MRSLISWVLLIAWLSPLAGLATEGIAASRAAEAAGENPDAALPFGVDQLYVSFQIVEADDGRAKAYFDVNPYYRQRFGENDLAAAAAFIARNVAEMLPFYIDAAPTKIDVAVIRISNLDEYNKGQGFTQVGDVVLQLVDGRWVVAGAELTGS